MLPADASINLAISIVIVVLPEPVGPIIPIVCPGLAERFIPFSMDALSYLKVTPSNSTPEPTLFSGSSGIYGLAPLGSIVNIYIFAFFYLLAFTGFGLMISNFAKSQQQAMFMVLFFLISFILLSGLFTPISSMPQWAQNVTLFNPLRYFIEVMRLIYLKGSGFMDILPHLLTICGFLVVFNTLAVLSYKKTTN